MIRKAMKMDADILTDLTFRSKAFWNYSPEQLHAWKVELAITTDYVLENEVFVLLLKSKVIGYYSWLVHDNDTVELGNLFIDPPCMNKGNGKILMNDFLERVKSSGKKKIRLFSEPQVEKFYGQFGFQTIGQHQSSIEGRFLPIMELAL
ncbi:MAG: GNAT family N-acetyltransferase [Crocinitomix sp.]|nr:GNAT family N-acetyltransferase [Crocinitomix sp.]